jgi:predicted TIM-barrel fold metal-dependent hydrolase
LERLETQAIARDAKRKILWDNAARAFGLAD